MSETVDPFLMVSHEFDLVTEGLQRTAYCKNTISIALPNLGCLWRSAFEDTRIPELSISSKGTAGSHITSFQRQGISLFNEIEYVVSIGELPATRSSHAWDTSQRVRHALLPASLT